MKLYLFILLAFCLAAIQCSAHSLEGEPQIDSDVPADAETKTDIAEKELDNRPLVEIEYEGLKYSVPVYEDLEFTEVRRNFDANMMAKLFGKLRNLIEMIVVKKKGHFAVGKAAMGIIPMAMTNAKELRKLQKIDSSPGLAPRYGQEMGDLMLDLMGTKTDETISNEEVHRRTHGLLTAIEKLCANSPTGLYLDWAKLTIDGQSMAEFVAPCVRWCRENGYGLELKIFDSLSALVKSFSGPRKQN